MMVNPYKRRQLRVNLDGESLAEMFGQDPDRLSDRMAKLMYRIRAFEPRQPKEYVAAIREVTWSPEERAILAFLIGKQLGRLYLRTPDVVKPLVASLQLMDTLIQHARQHYGTATFALVFKLAYDLPRDVETALINVMMIGTATVIVEDPETNLEVVKRTVELNGDRKNED